MGRILFLSIVLIFVGIAVFIGGSYLVVFWRDTFRRWRLERHADEMKQIEEANQQFIKAAKEIEKRGVGD